MSIPCPCCLKKIPGNPIYERIRVPVLNNVGYDSYELARNCPNGEIRLVQCPECGVVFNSKYDTDLIVYDESYENVRQNSPTYRKYLDTIAGFYASELDSESHVLEIGCGNGDFLRNLARVTGCRGTGYDYTYENEPCYGGRVYFYRKYFKPEEDGTRYHMLVLRHVLEHIPNPHEFMSEICSPTVLRTGTRLLLEVPSLEWIIENKTFYDITYEHCNYFCEESLSNFAISMGFQVEKIRAVFGGQYLLLDGAYIGKKMVTRPMSSFPKVEGAVEGFRTVEQKLIDRIRKADTVCVWGASGKGVIFLSGLPMGILKRISYVIDIDPAKQGKFLPGSGKRVDPPVVLRHVQGKLLALVMNRIYEDEIRSDIEDMGVDADLMVAV